MTTIGDDVEETGATAESQAKSTAKRANGTTGADLQVPMGFQIASPHGPGLGTTIVMEHRDRDRAWLEKRTWNLLPLLSHQKSHPTAADADGWLWMLHGCMDHIDDAHHSGRDGGHWQPAPVRPAPKVLRGVYDG